MSLLKTWLQFAAVLTLSAAPAFAPTAAQAGTLSVLHAFTGGADGADPMGETIRDAQGNVYGTAYDGGTSCTTAGAPAGVGCGTVWKIDTTGALSVLVTFVGTNGALPSHLVLRGTTLYGTTHNGGASDQGVIYKVAVDGSKFALLHQFDGTDGCAPGRPQIDSAGDVFAQVFCGAFGNHAIVKVAPDLSFTTLYSFPGAPSTVQGERIVLDEPAGLIYGTTWDATCSATGPACGTVFSLSTSGATYSTIFNFVGTQASPYVAFTAERNGTLFGVAGLNGGTGQLLSFQPVRKVLTIYHNFGPNDGSAPYFPIFGSNGVAYGTTFYGSANPGPAAGQGTLYSQTRSGTFTTLYAFTIEPGTLGLEGTYPDDSVAYDAATNTIYGSATYGGGTTVCTRPDGTQVNIYGCGTIFTYKP